MMTLGKIGLPIKMIIYKSDSKIYAYIHIPKNNGKYIRSLIRDQYKVIKKLWHVKGNLDLAHIPKSLYKKYVPVIKINQFITFTRNPYDRIISSYFYKYPEHNQKEFTKFITKDLSKIDFNNFYQPKFIHFFPQTKFIDSEVELIKCEELINNTIVGSCKLNIINLNLRKYNYKEYFNNDILSVINTIYNDDFIFCKYEKINEISYSS